jgi:hypothetical protein
MMKRGLTLGIMVVLVMAFIVIPVSALDPHTAGTGQPSQSCQAFFGDSGPYLPPGFNTQGFAHAETMYAGSGHTANGNNPHAVSQYDVACFQQFYNH